MSFQIPTEIAEVRVTYKSKVYAADHPQIRVSEDAHRYFRQIWDKDIVEYFEETFLRLLDCSNRIIG